MLLVSLDTWRSSVNRGRKETWGATEKEEAGKSHTKQEEKLHEYFATELAHGKLPSRMACEQFIRDHPWGWTKEQTNHKAKNLIHSS